MSIESIRNSGSVYQGSSPVQGTIRESSAVTTEGLQTSADEIQQENASVLENAAAQGQNPTEEEKATASSSEQVKQGGGEHQSAARLIQKQSLVSTKELIVLPLRLWIKRARK